MQDPYLALDPLIDNIELPIRRADTGTVADF